LFTEPHAQGTLLLAASTKTTSARHRVRFEDLNETITGSDWPLQLGCMLRQQVALDRRVTDQSPPPFFQFF
jgi:hypothetical protein